MAQCNPPALLAALAAAFACAGNPLAMGSEKRPRPIAGLAYPLPLGAEGLEEWADVTLEASLEDSPTAALARLSSSCPEGLEILGIEPIPHYASPVAELCQTAHWRWPCPAGLLKEAKAKMAAFEESDKFQITKTGKVDGQKASKSIEVRRLVKEIRWEGSALHFSTAIEQGQALNPQKLIAGILGVPPEEAQGLQRLRIELKRDPKLDSPDKYAHKLRNLYEDAVLLETSSNIVLCDEDDDEPIVLQRG
jgi:radical SAM-linked protein